MSIKIKISILAICFALLAAVCVGFAFAAPNEKLNLKGTLSYEVPRPVVMVSPSDPDLGSTTGSGDYTIGETVTLTATPSSSSNSSFLAWATSTNPNEMEIVSTSPTYSFEFLESSPKDYYALFNQTTSPSQTVRDLTYTFYNEAKLAMITGKTDSFMSEFKDFTIPSVVSNGENSYKVFSIGYGAFYGCGNLTSITIPEGVTSIGSNAFMYCPNLSSISIPKGVTEIGYQVFASCTSLKSITIPEGVTSIGESAFYACKALSSIEIPESVIEINETAFIGANLEIFYGKGNEYYTIDDGRALLVDGGKTLLAYAIGNAETSYEIPKGVTKIAGYAFLECEILEEITINGNITSLGSSAFTNSRYIKKLTLGAEVTSLPSGLFTSHLTHLTEIVVEEGSTLKDVALPTYGTWEKDGEVVTSFSGAGTYTRTDI